MEEEILPQASDGPIIWGLRGNFKEAIDVINELWTQELEETAGLRESAPEGFRLNDLGGLNWAFRKLTALSKKADEINSVADEEIRRIEEWRKGELKKIEDDVNWFRFLIEQFAREQRAKDPEWKASLPFGKVTFRKPTAKWHWEEESLVAWLDQYRPDLVRVKKEPKKDDVKKVLAYDESGRVYDPETGEPVPGVRVEIPTEETITIKEAK